MAATEVNRVDMNENGVRICALSTYGTNPVKAVMLAWGVVDSYLINPIISEDTVKRTPEPNWQSGPEYMLLFPDGLWRYASFCGINGPPWARCERDGYAASRGLCAWLKLRIAETIKVKDKLQLDLADCEKEIKLLFHSLSESSKESLESAKQ